MAKRFTDTEIWDKEWFMQLPANLKCLVQYVRDKCDMAGFWSPNYTLAETHLKEKITEKDLLSIDCGKQFKKLANGKIYCLGFIEFQYGENLTEKSPVHKKVLTLLKKNDETLDTLNDSLLNTLPSRGKEKEEDKEEEKEEDEEKEEGPEVEILEPYPFSEFWDMYDKKVGSKHCKPKFKKLSVSVRELIWQHVPAYVASTPDKQYRMNPETYLNGKHWEDEIVKPATSTGKLQGIIEANHQAKQELKALFANE